MEKEEQGWFKKALGWTREFRFYWPILATIPTVLGLGYAGLDPSKREVILPLAIGWMIVPVICGVLPRLIRDTLGPQLNKITTEVKATRELVDSLAPKVHAGSIKNEIFKLIARQMMANTADSIQGASNSAEIDNISTYYLMLDAKIQSLGGAITSYFAVCGHETASNAWDPYYLMNEKFSKKHNSVDFRRIFVTEGAQDEIPAMVAHRLASHQKSGIQTRLHYKNFVGAAHPEMNQLFESNFGFAIVRHGTEVLLGFHNGESGPSFCGWILDGNAPYAQVLESVFRDWWKLGTPGCQPPEAKTNKSVN